MKVLSDDEVTRALAWPAVLGALEAAFRRRAETADPFMLAERGALSAPGGTFLTMPCADAEGWFGVKQVSVLPGNEVRGLPTVQAWYTLMDPSGRPALACAATTLTRMRTAAVSALAARALALPDATRLLIVGTGALAPWLAEAHAQVRAYAQVLVWGRDLVKAQSAAADIGARLGGVAAVRAEPSLERALQVADVVSCATTATAPVLLGSSLRGGQHLDLVGAFLPVMREVDAEALRRAQVFVDDLAAARAEAGDLIQAAAEGWSFAAVEGDLAALMSGRSGRRDDAAITLFKSVGLALEDLVVARLLV